jgi:sugar lactone lactonase YvrE
MSALLRARRIFSFPAPTFVENIHTLPSGELLLSTLRDPNGLYILDPNLPDPQPRTVCQFDAGITGLSGIVPLPDSNDELYAVGGGKHLSFAFERGSMALFVVSLGKGQVVDRIPVDTEVMNGMATLPGRPHVVLSASSKDGRIHAIDTKTREVTVLIEDDRLAPPPAEEMPAGVPRLGINGIRTLGDFVYFANSARGTFCRFRVDMASGKVVGDIELLANSPGTHQIYDDFALDAGGNAYVAAHRSSLVKITLSGEQTTVIGGKEDSILKNPTSASMARDGRSVYVSTAGNSAANPPEGGQVVQVFLDCVC